MDKNRPLPPGDPTDDGIVDAYFAKKVMTKERTSEASTAYNYPFENTNVVSEENRSNIASIIERKSNKTLESDDRYVTLADILTVLENTTYEAASTISIPTKKLKDVESYERIDSAPLESILYVFAKTVNLDEKDVTITIREKEPLLVEGENPLPVIEVSGADGEEENGAEITELIETVDEGTFVKKIRLRPESDEDLQEWINKQEGGAEDGSHSYTVGGTFTVEGDADTIANTIKTRSDSALSLDHTVKKEDILAELVEGSTFTAGQTLVFPKYTTEKNVLKLWLKATAQGDNESHEEEFLNTNDAAYFTIGGVCACEARVRAYMRMLRVGEGTEGEEGYTTLFGGHDFTASPYNRNMSDHPRIQRPFGNTTSSAAGAYQVMGYTWDDANMIARRAEYNIEDFEPSSQDRFCIILFKYKRPGMLDEIIAGNIEEATAEYGSREWASLPMNETEGRYGQPNKSMTEALELYEDYRQEELAGNSDLYLPNGFLSEFGYSCCNNTETNEFGLVRLTEQGNANIINHGIEDIYSYQDINGNTVPAGQHGDDWITPEKAAAFITAVENLIAEYPEQNIHLNDCSAYNPNHNLGHSATGAHSRGEGFDSKFLTEDGNGSNVISSLSQADIAINARFITLLRATGQFSTFYSDNGLIPGSTHASGHADHLHGE